MLASISPLGERGRGQSYAITVAAYLAASTASGVLLGGILGGAGSVVSDRRVAVLGVVCVSIVGFMFDRRVVGLRVPGPRRQVDENWLVTYRGWVYGAGFGAQLGFAFTTIVAASATWIAFACAFASASVTAGIAIGGLFGLVRALPVLANARVHDPASLYSLMRAFERARPLVARVTTTVQLVGAAALGLAAA